MNTTPDAEPTPLEQSPYPLAFPAMAGDGSARPEPERAQASYRTEVMGLGRFQKEGLVTDVATGRSWRLPADEGKYLRGSDMAPAPLMHFAAGLHGDVTARIVRIARRRGVELDQLSVTFTQGFGSQGSFARGEAVALVGDLAWTIEVASAAPDPVVQDIVAQALATSPAYAAMTNAHEGVFALYTNGRPTPVVGVPQSGSPAEPDPFLAHAERPVPVDEAGSTEQLLVRSPSDGPLDLELSDDQKGAILWHIRASGNYRFDTDTVATTVKFPNAGATQWTLISDDTGRGAPSPLAYFSIGTAFCYHTQLCRYADVRRLPVSNPRLVQLSTFTSDETSADSVPFDTHLFLNGRVTTEETASLLTAAANTCYAHRGLGVAVASKSDVEVHPSRHNIQQKHEG
jgi:uncharacterized OsmC-like protein